MSATNPSSTRSPTLWAVRLEPSRLHQLASLTCGLSAISAIIGSGLPLWAVLGGCSASLTILIRSLVRLRLTRDLQLSADEQWSVSSASGRHVGALSRCLYCSSYLVILEITSAHGRRHPVPIWCDSLDEVEFSYLHCELMRVSGQLRQ